MSLFRDAAVHGRRRGLHGEVTIHQPVTFTVLTICLLVLAVAAVASLWFASFARKETAQGWIVPELGMAESYAPTGSLVQTIDVRVGQTVTKGVVLGSVSTETYNDNGALSQQEGRQIRPQMAELDTQIAAARGRQRIGAGRTREQIVATNAAMSVLEEQKRLQQDQLAVARRQYDSAAPLVARGFISRFDQDRRQQAVLSLRQALGALDQQIQGQKSQLVLLEAELRDGAAQQTVQESQLRAARANLASSAAALAARCCVLQCRAPSRRSTRESEKP